MNSRFRFRLLVRLLSICLSLFGLVALSFVAGTGAAYFRLPPSQFLNDAFQGGQAWFEKKREAAQPFQGAPDTGLAVRIDDAQQTFDGFTLFTTDKSSRALLVDMQGKEVHRWELPFSKVWSRPPHIKDPVEDSRIYYCGFHLFPDGSLLVVYQGLGDTPYGYGLAKLDRDSKLLWKYDGNVHHEVDVGDDGTIYALTQKIVPAMPKGLEYVPAPGLVDSLVLLSPDGSELKSVPILEAFRDSPYSLLFRDFGKVTAGQGPQSSTIVRDVYADPRGDVMHTNCVSVLTREMASRYPQFRAGQVLISLRSVSVIAVVDPETRKVVWAARGVWKGQHGAKFLDNGHLLLLDNQGARAGSRVLEFDPQNQGFDWWYPDETSTEFFTPLRGLVQRLPNGNTFMVCSHTGELREVNRRKEIVWSAMCKNEITSARRYGSDELHFLEEGQRPRP
jgi:hypothetical protein